DGTNDSARFFNPCSITVDANGKLYVADSTNHTIRQVTQSGTNWIVTTIAGLAGTSGRVDGTNSNARFNTPQGIAVSRSGNIYVSDSLNDTIRELALTGTNWVVTTIAGLAGSSGGTDGTNSSARFTQPFGIAIDATENLFVADSASDTLRKLTRVGTNWIVSTIGGVAQIYGSADGTGSDARFFLPSGMAVDPAGGLFIMDGNNSTVRLGWTQPLLQMSVSGDSAILTWPASTVGYLPQITASLTPAFWTPVGGQVGISSGSFRLTNRVTPDAGFFRLQRQ
ncbi:MAG TPA: hypothetical protein VN281_06160, partial [Verrucomicrobiae bacterium]|nr:hypothetical protein [Verrucomicrobiae bacterium]